MAIIDHKHPGKALEQPKAAFAPTAECEILPQDVVNLIRVLIKRGDVQSVSFPFEDERVWRMLIEEQIDRARLTGLHLQHAFGLSGPDSGLPFDTAVWGGYVHIPCEGACEGDLFIKPAWRGCDLKAAMGDGDLTAAMLGKQCNHVILKGECREVDSATRTIVDGWTLYSSKKTCLPNNPFMSFKFHPNEPLPSPYPVPY